jgi:WD40 repeat protein
LIWDLVQSPQEAHVLASASQDATVQLWDDRDVVQRAHSTLSTNAMAALALDWHAVQSHLISVGLENGDVLSFDTRATKTPLTSVVRTGRSLGTIFFSANSWPVGIVCV